MPAAARKAAISFGMVYIPVSLYTAVQEKGIGFNQLTADGVRVRQKKVREDTGAKVKSSEIVKGYEYAKDQYVIITDDEMERIKTERDKAINILHFTTPDSIPSVYFDKSYLAAPDGSDKAYELLRRVMQERGVIGIARSVLWTKETMMALIPEENGIRLQTLFYQSQIKYVPMPTRRTEVSDMELGMGRMLIDSMIKPYQPELYKDEYAHQPGFVILDALAFISLHIFPGLQECILQCIFSISAILRRNIILFTHQKVPSSPGLSMTR